LLLWLTFFFYGSSLYFLINWLPTLVTKSGFSIGQGGAVTATYQFGGLVGGFLIGYLVDRAGLRMLIASTFAACLAIALTGLATGSLAAIFVAAFTVGLLVIGNQHTVNSLARASTPTLCGQRALDGLLASFAWGAFSRVRLVQGCCSRQSFRFRRPS
jgi:AAHS family 4-hydroxybenzoate transporter-like MFS transporter